MRKMRHTLGILRIVDPDSTRQELVFPLDLDVFVMESELIGLPQFQLGLAEN